MMIGYYGFAVRLFACIFLIGLVILVAVGIIAVMRFPGMRNTRPPGNPAYRILDERYARGEISLEEYRRMKSELGHDPGRT